jgi:tetratricopeptide (TPR) repeat protein
MSTVSAPICGSQKLKRLLFAALAAGLVWEVTSRTFVAFLANVAPEQALHIRSQQPTALLKLAQANLIASGDKQARHMAEQALLSDPLNAQALRILGQIAELSKDRPRAWQFMQAAVRRSLNESVAAVWLMYRSAERRDYAAAMHYADVLLRTRPQLGSEVVIPVLARIAEDKEAVVAFKEMLARDPPWRTQFFDALPGSITDARIPLDLLLALKHSPVPPAAAELRSYLNFLIGKKLYALAYYTWLQLLPPDQISGAGFVFNGGFQTVPSGLPFDWLISPGAGATVDIDTAPDDSGHRALFARFEDGRVDFGRVAQLIMLAPAKYRLEVTYKGTLLGQRGLRWRVTCVDGPTAAIGESAMIKGISSVWKTVGFSFTVPGSNCPAQYLHLDLDARMASERFVSGEVWFDNVRILRAGDAAQ